MQNQSAVDFSANINPFGTPAQVTAALNAAVSDASRYPDANCRLLAESAEKALGIPREKMLFGNGAADLIYRFARSLPKGKHALVVEPTFCEYSRALEAAGVEYRSFALSPENGFTPDEKILSAVGKDTGAVFICTPNNPTGALFPPALLEKLAATGVYLLCDISFLPFCPRGDIYEVQRLIDEYPNAVFLFSFTKCFAIPGVRLGSAFSGDPDILLKMSKQGDCWSVSCFAQAAGAAVFESGRWFEMCVAAVAAEKERLSAELKKRGLCVFPSSANFLLVRAPRPLAGLLAEKNVIVRDCSNFRGLDETYFRCSVRTSAENDLLLKAADEVLK